MLNCHGVFVVVKKNGSLEPEVESYVTKTIDTLYWFPVDLLELLELQVEFGFV